MAAAKARPSSNQRIRPVLYQRVIGLCLERRGGVGSVGLTPEQAAIEARASLDILASASQAQALGEAAWATLSGGWRAIGHGLEEPPALAPRLLWLEEAGAGLPKTLTGQPGRVSVGRSSA
jgi:hypothetical protein